MSSVLSFYFKNSLFEYKLDIYVYLCSQIIHLKEQMTIFEQF